jgi:hypothetical protein
MDLSIVILDDNPGSLELLSAALSREGVAQHGNLRKPAAPLPSRTYDLSVDWTFKARSSWGGGKPR